MRLVKKILQQIRGLPSLSLQCLFLPHHFLGVEGGQLADDSLLGVGVLPARCCGTGVPPARCGGTDVSGPVVLVLLVLADDPDVTVGDEKDLLVAVLAPPPPVLAGLTVEVESLSSREAQSSRSVRNEVVLGHGVLDWLKVLLLLLCGEPLVKVTADNTVI